jgi:hypothetical protein
MEGSPEDLKMEQILRIRIHSNAGIKPKNASLRKVSIVKEIVLYNHIWLLSLPSVLRPDPAMRLLQNFIAKSSSLTSFL